MYHVETLPLQVKSLAQRGTSSKALCPLSTAEPLLWLVGGSSVPSPILGVGLRVPAAGAFASPQKTDTCLCCGWVGAGVYARCHSTTQRANDSTAQGIVLSNMSAKIEMAVDQQYLAALRAQRTALQARLLSIRNWSDAVEYIAPCLRLTVEPARCDSAPGQSLAREMSIDG